MQHERGRQDLFEDVTLRKVNELDLKERLPKNETEMNLDVVKIEFVVLDGV
jgi:hypothetical protein